MNQYKVKNVQSKIKDLQRKNYINNYKLMILKIQKLNRSNRICQSLLYRLYRKNYQIKVLLSLMLILKDHDLDGNNQKRILQFKKVQ